MNSEFLEHVIWGNTIRQYIVIVSILLIGLLFKRIISRGLSKLFFRVFKKFADQVNPETFISLLIRPVEFFLSVLTLFIALKQLKHPLNVAFFSYKKTVGTAKITEVFTIGELVDKVFLFLILLSIFWIVLRVIDFIAHVLLVRAAKTKNRADDQLVPFIKELLKFLISFIGFFVLLGYVFEVNAVSLITGLGIGGIAIAMAAKESLENLLGSFLIFLDKPFTVGDVVKVDGVEGTIERVGFRSTVLRSPDKTTYVIPNRAMIDGVLENLTLRNARRVKFDIALTYETSSEVVKQIIAELDDYLKKHTGTVDSTVGLDSFANFALNIQIIYLVPMQDDLLKIKEEINYKIVEVVQKYGSEFAYPTQRTVGEIAPANEEK